MNTRESLCLLAMLAVASPGMAAEDPAAPEGCHWEAIPELRMQLAVPDGWEFEAVSKENPLVYEVRPAGESFQNPPSARFRLTVDRGGDPATAVETARKFVEELRSQGAPTGEMEQHEQGVVSAFVSVIQMMDADTQQPRSTVAVSALGNSRTGTVYRTKLEIPLAEFESVAPLAIQLFQTVRIDDEI